MVLPRAGFPSYRTAERAVDALVAVRKYARIRERFA